MKLKLWRRKRGQMKRIALALAVAAIGTGASATTASSSICLCDSDDGTVVRVTTVRGAPPLHKAPAKAKKKAVSGPSGSAYSAQ